MNKLKPIGVFDSGYGGLTILKELVKVLPEHDFLYLGDNARAPYGTRSFETVYQYTLEAVRWFFYQGCELVVLACNTASAKALRTIQQKDLPQMDPQKRVLGVIRPTAEVIGNYSNTGSVGIVGTLGTVSSNSYPIEIHHFFPQCSVYQEACPMWVPLIENGEAELPGADYFVQKHLQHLFAQSDQIDTLLLACTHYPLLLNKIVQFLPGHIRVVAQGEIVANSLSNYLERHPEINHQCSKEASLQFYTTDSTVEFERQASLFFGKSLTAHHTDLAVKLPSRGL
ncbi:MAG: glutamate racemase [Chitinophagia bacterium]|nr:glutamate racemase [Chitinophagia bacterium]